MNSLFFFAHQKIIRFESKLDRYMLKYSNHIILTVFFIVVVFHLILREETKDNTIQMIYPSYFGHAAYPSLDRIGKDYAQFNHQYIMGPAPSPDYKMNTTYSLDCIDSAGRLICRGSKINMKRGK